MKQLQLDARSDFALRDSLFSLRALIDSEKPKATVLHIYTAGGTFDELSGVCASIDEIIPEALYLGATCSATIGPGEYEGSGTRIFATLYYSEGIRAEVLHFPYVPGDVAPCDQTDEAIVRALEDRPWAQGAELFCVSGGEQRSGYGRLLGSIPERITVMGARAMTPQWDTAAGMVFSNCGKVERRSAVMLVLGGPEIEFCVSLVSGWSAVGRRCALKTSSRQVISELDNLPPVELYKRYLGFENDRYFLKNAVGFPLLCTMKSGEQALRSPREVMKNGALAMCADCGDFETAAMAYGSARKIREELYRGCAALAAFSPECIRIYDCELRRAYWSSEHIAGELSPLDSVAPIAGMFSGSEYIRPAGGKFFMVHNQVLLAIGVREDHGKGAAARSRGYTAPSEPRGVLSIEDRLVNFLSEATSELEQANARLRHMAATDSLTGLSNRIAMREALNGALEEGGSWTVVMADIDGFKQVNDTYGHLCGDQVIVALSKLIETEFAASSLRYRAGRYGGDEFIVLSEGEPSLVLGIVNAIRAKFSALKFDYGCQCTLSLGLAPILKGDDEDRACRRADRALYRSKGLGRNRATLWEADEA